MFVLWFPYFEGFVFIWCLCRHIQTDNRSFLWEPENRRRWSVCLHLWHLISCGADPSLSLPAGRPRSGGRPRQRGPQPVPGLRPSSLIPPPRAVSTHICGQTASWIHLCTPRLRVRWTPPAQNLPGAPARGGRGSDVQPRGKNSLWIHDKQSQSNLIFSEFMW